MEMPNSKCVMIRPDTLRTSNDKPFTHSSPAWNFSPKTIGWSSTSRLKISSGAFVDFEYFSNRSDVSALVSKACATATEDGDEYSIATDKAKSGESFVLNIAVT